jgi:hypothetical protein
MSGVTPLQSHQLRFQQRAGKFSDGFDDVDFSAGVSRRDEIQKQKSKGPG